jgi:hypothetical protein
VLAVVVAVAAIVSSSTRCTTATGAAVDVVFAVLAREAALLTDEGPEAYEPSPGYDAAYAELVDDLGIGASAIPFLTKWYGRSPR